MSTRTKIIIVVAVFLAILVASFWHFRYQEPRPAPVPYVPAPKSFPTASPSPKMPVSTPTPISSPTAPKSAAKRALIAPQAMDEQPSLEPRLHSRFWYAGEVMDGGLVVPSGLFAVVDIGNINNMRAYYDISDEVTRGADGHPDFSSIDGLARELLGELSAMLEPRE